MDVQLARFAGFTLRTTCPRCGMPLPLNVPAQQVTCRQCQAEVPLPAEVWSHALARFESDERPPPGTIRTEAATVAGFALQLQLASLQPSCERCSAEYPAEPLGADRATDFACTACGDPASSRPAPDWLRASVPTLRQLISTDPGDAGAAPGPPPAGQGGGVPALVAMACPRCAAGLRITTAHQRIVPCQFCEAAVFLPDEVWRRLHPVETVRWWFARFDGKTPSEARRDAQAAAVAAQRAGDDQRIAAARRILGRVWLLVGAFAAWQAVAVAAVLGGARGASAAPYVVVSLAAYAVAVAACGRARAIASGGSWLKLTVGLGLLGGVAASLPIAGVLLAAVMVWFATAKERATHPTRGIGTPLVVVYLAQCLLAQVLFFTDAL